MRRTSWPDLALPFVVIGVIVYVLLGLEYDSLPPLQYAVPLPIVALAAAELVAARRVRAAVRHDPNARPMAALVIARCVALGKASALVGAAVAGASIGLVAYLLPDLGTLRAARHDASVGGLLLLAALVLAAAGLLLERAGVDPSSR